ncbi:lasso peptide biosynthesis PqqD family chaperone [Streptomyces sp. NPDC050433]|uniref:lasso peptide biosynthesis PqqD family chaperone n=1 Tax=Streptomyces sp. NPDC050433 TaxID=3365615 RepID=UPI0037A7148F
MTVALAAHVTTTDVGDALVLLDERNGRYWQLNGTGATVLRLTLHGSSPDEIASELCGRYPIGSEQAIGDVHTLLTALRDAKLVTA